MIIRFYTKFFSRLVRSLVIGLTILGLSSSPLNVFAEATYDPSFYAQNDILFYNPSDTSCASSGGSVNQLSGSDNRQKIWNYLTARGLSNEQAAGVLGNIQSESGGTFSPTINEYSQTFPGGGYGIVQWTGGRRDNVLAALTSANPDLVAKYYNVDYSTYVKSYTGAAQGFVSKSASTGTLMPVADNDALLLTELNFLYQESTNRTVSSAAIARTTGASKGETEWDALKKQTTIQNASNLWVYSFEIPASIDQTAIARVTNGQKIYDMYSNATSGAACTASVSGDKKAIALAIINNKNITFEAQAGKDIVSAIAAGTNNGNDFPCGMNINILKLIEAVGTGHTIRINSTNRACYNEVPSGGFVGDAHFNGNGSAVDFGRIDGKPSYQSEGANLIITLAAPYILNNSGIGQTGCFSTLTNLPPNIKIRRFPDACTHLHIDILPNTDPNLKCRPTLGCDKSQQT
jgi:hypothetical protein